MKNTRRFISAVMALAMVSAIAPMSAFAITQDDIDPDTGKATGEMTATYDVTAKYTVTIPAGVTLDSTNAVSKNIEASDVMLESGQKINVTLDEASHTTNGTTFHAQNTAGDSTATYTINNGTKDIAVGDVVATFANNPDKTADPDVQTSTLTFSKAEGATYAGTHTETLTFGIAVETEVNVSSIKIMYGGRELTEMFGTTVYVDETIALTAETDPEGATVTWSSSDPSIATVDQNGVVRGVGVGDNVIITATAGGKTAKCRIAVMFG